MHATASPEVWSGRRPGMNSAVVLTIGCIAALGLASLTLIGVSRRLAGALREPLGFGPLCSIGLSLGLAAIVAHACWKDPRAESPLRKGWPLHALLTALVLIAGLALSLPGSSILGLVALWLMLIAAEGASWALLARSPRWRPAADEIPAAVPPVDASADMPDQTTLTMTRRRIGGRTDVIEGAVRISFAPGQRTEVAHVAFCPPMEAVPEFHLEQLDGPPARLKDTQLLPYGVRIEAKLNAEPQHATSIIAQFVARDPERAADA